MRCGCGCGSLERKRTELEKVGHGGVNIFGADIRYEV